MGTLAKRCVRLGFFAVGLAGFVLAYEPVAHAQFFMNWFNQEPARPKPHVVKPAPPPGDDLPAIVPKESMAPPPPDDRPYDTKLLRLAEILGAVHYLRELCGAGEGQTWRVQMEEIVKYEGTTAVRRAKLVNSFNDGYRGYRRTYRSCTESASLANARFTEEGAEIAAALAKPQQFVNRTPLPIDQSPPQTQDGKPQPGADTAKPDATKPDTAKPVATKPDVAKPNAAKPNTAKADQAAGQEAQQAADPVKPGQRKRKGQKQPSQDLDAGGF
jgi:uncharacterized protein (TIGR02301 family)